MDQSVKNGTKTVINDHPKDTDKHWHSVLHIEFSKESDEEGEEEGDVMYITPTLSVAFFKRIGARGQGLGGTQPHIEDAFRLAFREYRGSRPRTDFPSIIEAIKGELQTNLIQRFSRQDIEFSVVSDVKWRRLVTDPTPEESREWRLQGTFCKAGTLQTMSDDLQRALSGNGQYSFLMSVIQFADSTSSSRKRKGEEEPTSQSEAPRTKSRSRASASFSTRSAKRGGGTGENSSRPHGLQRSLAPQGSG